MQLLAAHRRGETMTKARGESNKNESNIGAAGNVIGDKDEGAFQIGEVFATHDARVRQQ